MDDGSTAAIGNELGFEVDIKPLFRELDRVEMEYYCDLWDYKEVREEAKDLYARLEDGSMPCDAPWCREKLELFRKWIDTGCAP